MEEQPFVDLPSSFPNDVLRQWLWVPCLINYAELEEKIFPFVLNLNVSSDAISCYTMRCQEKYINFSVFSSFSRSVVSLFLS